MSNHALPMLPESLSSQLQNFLSVQMARCLAHYNEPKLRVGVQKYFDWIYQFAFLHYQSRIQRATDLETPEVIEAQDLARRYIGAGNHDFFVTCVDGRNMPTVMYSKPPHVGGVLRAPAGVVTGFMEGQKPLSVFIDHDSFVVKQLVKLIQEKAGDTIFYGLDSHVGCAARSQIHDTEGGQQKDGGLRADIMSKIMTAFGILQLRTELKEKGHEVAEIVPIFFSYNPHSGGVYGGLELHIDEEEVAKHGFTTEVIQKLLNEEKIVSTFDLLADPGVVEQLTQAIPPKTAEFRWAYASSLQRNWQAITRLYQEGHGELYLKILAQLTKAYGLSGWVIGQTDSLARKTISERTLKQKAKFLLKNLVTRFSIAGAEPKWPFDAHQEEMVVITDGGYAPFPELDAFAVFSRDLNALLTNTKLTIDLIRSLRCGGKIQDPVLESKLTQDEFLSAPVLISNKAILKGFQSQSWQALAALHLEKVFERIDWDDPQTLAWRRSDLDKLVTQAAKDHNVQSDLHDALLFMDGLYELFDRMRLMMKDKYFRQMILNGYIVVLNTLLDQNRRPKLIVHFVV